MGDVDIDLYGDVEQEFSQEEFGEGDLYDAVLTGGNDRGRSSLDIQPEIGQNGTAPRNTVKSRSSSVCSEDRTIFPGSGQSTKYQLYVGNLNWWTTDEDIIQAVQSIGVSDVIDIKFHENRANGQSKGFCTLGLSSESSSRIVMDKLGRKEIQGMNPVVAYFTKQALLQFESKSKTRASPQQQQQQRMVNNQGPRMPPPRMPHMAGMDHRPGPPGMHGPPHGISHGPPMPAHGLHGPPRGLPAHAMGMNMNPNFDHLPRPIHPPPGGNMPMRGPPPPIAPTINVPPPRPPPPVIDNRHVPIRPDFLQIPPPMHGAIPQSTAGPPPAPHVNPAFFPHSGPPPSTTTPAPPTHFPPPGHNQIVSHTPYSDHRLENPPPISEAEFEDIMNRNRTVSSSAIARAVADASSGEYAGAIETLVTAISLIKQSKVAHDERCKILISSLQDTLHGIEAKSYGMKRRERSRSPRRHRRERSRSRGYRSRSHSREREYERPRERGENKREREYERAYSSERDYDKEREKERDRERERERERYYEDRYRERERERRERIEERIPRERIEERSTRDDGREREREREIRTRDDRESSSHRSRH